MESGNLFCFWKMKENENPKKRFEQQRAQTKMFLTTKKGDIVFAFCSKKRECFFMLKIWTIERKIYWEKENFSEQMLQKIERQEGSGEETTLIGVYAHVEVHTTHFLLNMQSGSSQSFLGDSGFFFFEWWEKVNASRQGHRPLFRCLAFGRPSTVSEHSEFRELVVASHTAMYWICGTRTVFSTPLSSTMCKMTTVSPSVLIHHSHTSSYRVNHAVFWFWKALSRSLVAQEENNRHQCQSDWPTDERRAPKTISVSLSHVHTSKGRETTFRSWPQSFRKVVRLLFDLLNNTQNKEAHKRTEGTPSFRRRHTVFKLWQMSKDSDRPTQTQKETQGALTTHSHTIAPNTSLSSKVTARPCWEKRFLCCDNSRTRELLWHCENSERGEFCEFWAHSTRIPHFLA